MSRLLALAVPLALAVVAACQGKSASGDKEGSAAGGAGAGAEAGAAVAEQAAPTGNPELVRAGELLVEGARDGAAILEVVSAERGTLARCYEDARKADPTVAGELGIRFFIKADGTVPDAILHNAQITDRNMGRCLMNAFKALKFPEAPGDTKATLPLVFGDAPGEQAG